MAQSFLIQLKKIFMIKILMILMHNRKYKKYRRGLTKEKYLIYHLVVVLRPIRYLQHNLNHKIKIKYFLKIVPKSLWI